jgi:hypothetical protein
VVKSRAAELEGSAPLSRRGPIMTDPRRSVAKRRPTAHLDGGKIEAAVGPSSEPPVRLTRRGGSGSCLAEIASNLAVVVGLHVASRELAAGVPDANRVPSKRRLLQGQRRREKAAERPAV